MSMLPTMPHSKIDPLLQHLLEGRPGASQRAIVLLRDDRVARAVARNFAVHWQFALLQGFATWLTASELEHLAAVREVVAVHRDQRVHTCPAAPPAPDVQPQLMDSARIVGAPMAWARGLTGAGIRVAVVDTGVDATHPHFAGRILACRNFTGEDDEADHNGHGTHVAGIISGELDGHRGIAYEAGLLIAKVLGHDGSGYTSDVIAGIEWAIEAHARVINLSLGSSQPSRGDDPLSRVCDIAVERCNTVVAAAAGNAGPGPGTVGSPGAACAAITVGATDKQDRITDYSSRGPTLDRRDKPDLVAPGHRIKSCRARGTSLGQPVDERWTTLSGTSMATPHIAASAALALQQYGQRPAGEMRHFLQQMAHDLHLDRNTQGAGRLDLRPLARGHTVHAAAPAPEDKRPAGAVPSQAARGAKPSAAARPVQRDGCCLVGCLEWLLLAVLAGIGVAYLMTRLLQGLVP